MDHLDFPEHQLPVYDGSDDFRLPHTAHVDAHDVSVCNYEVRFVAHLQLAEAVFRKASPSCTAREASQRFSSRQSLACVPALCAVRRRAVTI